MKQRRGKKISLLNCGNEREMNTVLAFRRALNVVTKSDSKKVTKRVAMNVKELIKVFEASAGIAPDGDDSIVIGTIVPIDCDAAVDAIMLRHTRKVDLLIAGLPFDRIQRLHMLFMRAFTYNEFLALFDTSITEPLFPEHPAFNYFLLKTNKERKRFIYSLTPNRYEYTRLLARCLRSFHPQLYYFLYAPHTDSPNF